MNVKKFLTDHKVKFKTTPHAKAFTAQEVAATEHVPGDEVAKPVILTLADGSHVMLVCPASHRIDLARAAERFGEEAKLAHEADLRRIFQDVELGAEPPFGSQYGLATYVDPSLARQEHLTFRAGSHTETITMSWADYVRIEQPTVADLARHL